MKIVINNTCGFQISQEALDRYNELRRERGYGGGKLTYKISREQDRQDDLRCDPIFVRVVEELGERAHRRSGRFTIYKLNDEYYNERLWEFREFDGATWVELNDRAIELWRELQQLRPQSDRLNSNNTM